jgi:hypothetical protein
MDERRSISHTESGANGAMHAAMRRSNGFRTEHSITPPTFVPQTTSAKESQTEATRTSRFERLQT